MINMFFKNTLYVIICLICIIFCIFGCTIQTSQNSQISQYSETSVTSINQSNADISNNCNDYIEYVKSHNIDFFDYVVEGEGDIKTNDSYGYNSSIRFKVADNQVENARRSLSKQLGDELEISEETLPHNSSNKYMQMVEKEKVIANWNKLENGYDSAKTHSIEIFLTENNGTYFIYFFD